MTKHQRFSHGVTREAISSVGSTHGFARRIETLNLRRHICIDANPTHVIMRHGAHFHGTRGEINPVLQ